MIREAGRARQRRGLALGEITEALQRLEEVYAAYAEADADFDALAKEQARLESIR